MVVDMSVDDLSCQRGKGLAVGEIGRHHNLLTGGVIPGILIGGGTGNDLDRGQVQQLAQSRIHLRRILPHSQLGNGALAAGLGDVKDAPNLIATVLTSVLDVGVGYADLQAGFLALDTAAQFVPTFQTVDVGDFRVLLHGQQNVGCTVSGVIRLHIQIVQVGVGLHGGGEDRIVRPCVQLITLGSFLCFPFLGPLLFFLNKGI